MRQSSKHALAAVLTLATSFLGRVTFAATIDRLDVWTLDGYSVSHSASASDFMVLEWPHVYYLNDGTSWQSGAGGYGYGTVGLTSQTVTGGTVSYMLALAAGDSYLMNYTDYDSGDHSSQGEIAPFGSMVLTAPIGSKTATMNGYAEIVSDTMTWYGEPRFNYYSAPVGDAVPFTLTYTLLGSTWQPGIFNTNFNYNMQGTIDFTHPVPEPSTLALLAAGALGLCGYGWRWRRRTSRPARARVVLPATLSFHYSPANSRTFFGNSCTLHFGGRE